MTSIVYCDDCQCEVVVPEFHKEHKLSIQKLPLSNTKEADGQT